MFYRAEYPKHFVKRFIKQSIIKHKSNSKNNSNATNNDNYNGICITPYIKNLSQQLNHIARQYNVRLVTIPGSKLGTILKHKLPTDKLMQINPIYQIPCKNHDCNYIGETKRRLGTRVEEHKDAKIKNHIDKSCIAAHFHDSKHVIDWDNVKILTIESDTQLRKIKEGILIQSDVNSYNKQYGDQYKQATTL